MVLLTMCRIFGFRSVLTSAVHKSLVEADNGLLRQSQEHPDGWGVAYYIKEAPHLIRSAETAFQDQLFKKVSGVVTSHTVVAHIRKATAGDVSVLNTHPFQFGDWIFAHNGHIANFESIRGKLLERIDPSLKRFILGSTDSEAIFFYILQKMNEQISHPSPFRRLLNGVQSSLRDIQEIAGPYSKTDSSDLSNNFLTFLITNGKMMIAHQGGKPLLYSTHKKRCSERDTCRHFAPFCEAPPEEGFVNHLVITSETIEGENIWNEMIPGQIVGVDGEMRFFNSIA